MCPESLRCGQVATTTLRPKGGAWMLGLAGLLAGLLGAPPARAFTPAGHQVLETMAYRALGASPTDQALLAYLIEAGAIERPICRDRRGACADRFENDPLAFWPAPHTDTPDMILARQFDHVGQCFHFMAQQDDETPPHYGNPAAPAGDPHVSYQLQWTAYDRCVGQLRSILDSILHDPRAARFEARGMYELMHAVMDSYSMAHTERDYTAAARGVDPPIRYLKVWQPTVPNPFSDASRNSRHEIFETRDDDFIQRFKVVPTTGRPCTFYVSLPYAMPGECLSASGLLAVGALEDLIRTVVHLLQYKSGHGEAETKQETDRAWGIFVNAHLAHVASPPRSAAEPTVFADRERIPYLFLGSRLLYAHPLRSSQKDILDQGLFARYVLTSGAFDPLTLGSTVEVGSRAVAGQATQAVVREDVDAELELGDRVSVALTPLSVGAIGRQLEVTSRAVRLEIFEPFGLRRVAFTLGGPVEFSWLDGTFRFGGGVGVSGDLLEHYPGSIDRTASDPSDPTSHPTWTHPAAWDGELRTGFSLDPTFGAYIGATAGREGVSGSAGSVEEGIQVELGRRNPWGRLNAVSGGLLAGFVVSPSRNPTPETRLQLRAAADVRVYVFRPFALLGEAGYLSPSAVTTGVPQSGFVRGGLALTVGALDFILLSPSYPQFSFNSEEILTARLGIDLP